MGVLNARDVPLPASLSFWQTVATFELRMTITRHQTLSTPESPALAGAPKVHVVTFGCQMNKYDSELVEGRFRRRGYSTTESMDDADVLLFNTCSVRDHAEERTWSWVGELKRAKERRPDLVIGIMGCMAQRVEEEVFKRAGHVDLVAGTRQFQNLPHMVDQVRERRAAQGATQATSRLVAVETSDDVRVDRTDVPFEGGSHAYLAVMRGCDLSCTYCIVPTTRGPVRSRHLEDLLQEVRWMVAGGVRVITLLGQTVNSYGEDFDPPSGDEPGGTGRQGRPSLADLLRRLQEVEGLARIRLVTLHPSYVTRAFAEAIRDCDKVERFLPLPAQAGSDAILRGMKRGYNLDLYRRRADILREIVPDIELGSDWIVGFPGEEEVDFQGTLDFLEEQQFLVNYVFKYDPRPGTHADERLANSVSDAIKKERNQRLLAAAEIVQRGRCERVVGQEIPVWLERASERDPGLLLGRTLSGMPASCPGPAEWVNSQRIVRLDTATPFGVAGFDVPPPA